MSTPEEKSPLGGFDPARWLWLLDRASPQLLAQLAFHGQLLHLEWQQEKRRLQWVLLFSVLSFSSVLLALLLAGFCILYLNRGSENFSLLLWVLPLFFALLAIGSMFMIQQLRRTGQAAFTASCQELIADIQLLRGQA